MTDHDDKHWLKPGQVDAMREGAREGRHPQRDDAIVTLLYDTGLRRGELSLVDRAMVDLEDELERLRDENERLREEKAELEEELANVDKISDAMERLVGSGNGGAGDGE